MNRVLFLDRDGTINIDKGYLKGPEGIELIPGAGRAIVNAQQAGFKIAVITNQAGIAKGVTPLEAVPLIHRRLETLIAQEAGTTDFRFDHIEICPHKPEDKCRCRKPEALMIERAQSALNANMQESWFVGDHLRDLQAAHSKGLRFILVRTGHGDIAITELNSLQKENKTQNLPTPVYIAQDLQDTVQFIFKNP